jgi:hypothetical protein
LLGKDAAPGSYFFECPLDERVFAFSALCLASAAFCRHISARDDMEGEP